MTHPSGRERVGRRSRARGALLVWAVLVVIVGLESAAGQADVIEPSEPQGAPLAPGARAAPDTLRAACASGAYASMPGVRVVGSGWPGHRAALAGGALPATMTSLVVAGRSGDDWLAGGLDLLSTWRGPGGLLVVQGGPDLSFWPAHSMGLSATEHGSVAATLRGGTIVAPSPRPPRDAVALSRATFAQASRGFRASAIEFEKPFLDGAFGVLGFYENREGRAPIGGGRSDLGSFGGSVEATGAPGLVLRFDGSRTETERVLPLRGLSPSPLVSTEVRSDLTISLVGRRSSLRLSRTSTWVRSMRGDAEPSVDTAVDGAEGAARLGWAVIDSCVVRAERREAHGALLSGSARDFGLAGVVSKAVRLSGGARAVVAGGASSLGDDVYPLVHLSLTSDGGGAFAWRTVGCVVGRHPTVLERVLSPVVIPAAGGPASVRGSERIAAERAVVVLASCERNGAPVSVGMLAEAARVLSPATLRAGADSALSPENGDAETAGVVAVWAGTDPGGTLGCSVIGQARADDEEGELLARTPIPRAEIRGRIWVVRRLLARGVLRARLAVSVSHESGRARGPWKGAVEDGSTALAVEATGVGGPVKFFIAVEDALETAGACLPGVAPFGRRVSAGFTWEFRN